MEVDKSFDPGDVGLLGAAAVAAQAREAADMVQKFRHEVVPLTGVEERGYFDRGHGGRGYKSCIGEGRAGVECEGVARGL